MLEQEVDGEAMMALTENDIDMLLSETNQDGSKSKAKLGIKRKFETKLKNWKTEMEVLIQYTPTIRPVSTGTKSKEENGKFEMITTFSLEKVCTICVTRHILNSFK